MVKTGEIGGHRCPQAGNWMPAPGGPQGGDERRRPRESPQKASHGILSPGFLGQFSWFTNSSNVLGSKNLWSRSSDVILFSKFFRKEAIISAS